MKKRILCIIGKSGSGKTTVAEYIQEKYNIKMIESITDRPPRYDGEPGHAWVTKEEFDSFKQEEMIAYTQFGDYRYCCLKKDVNDSNTYVIDEYGYKYLKKNFSDVYEIKSLYIYRSKELRKQFVSEERINRDEGKFNMGLHEFDYDIENNYGIEDLKWDVDELFKNHVFLKKLAQRGEK